MKKIKNPWADKEGYNCFGCAPDNPMGLKMQFYEDGDEVVSIWQPSTHHQGWIDTLHGGIIATLVDETGAWLITRKLQTTAMTVRLNINYRRPIMTNAGSVTVRSRLAQQMRNFITVAVDVMDSDNKVCAQGEIIYCTFDHDRAREMGFSGCDLED